MSPCLRQQSRSCFLRTFGEGAAGVCPETLHYAQSFEYFFLFPFPTPLSPREPPVAYTPAQPSSSADVALEFQLLAQSFCRGRKSAKCIRGFGLKRTSRASLALPSSAGFFGAPGWYPWVCERGLQANSLN